MRLRNFLAMRWVRMGIKVAREGASVFLNPGHFGDTLTPFENLHYLARPQARQRLVRIDV